MRSQRADLSSRASADLVSTWWRSTAPLPSALRRGQRSVPSPREFPAESQAKAGNHRSNQQADCIHDQKHWHKDQRKELVHGGTVDQSDVAWEEWSLLDLRLPACLRGGPVRRL